MDGYCGIARMFQTFSKLGCPSVKWDKKLGQDILTSGGFVQVMTWGTLMLPTMSAGTFGILCSSWVFMCTSSTNRSELNPMGLFRGKPSTKKVEEGNLMVSRQVLILQYFTAQAIIYLMEQPITSLMRLHERLVELFKKLHLFTTTTWMGRFGADSAKGTWLMSNSQTLLDGLTRNLVRNEHVFQNDDITRPHYSGGSLAWSEYPEEFCVEVAISARSVSFPQLLLDVPSPGVPQVTDLWEDARSGELAKFIGLPNDRLVC